MCYVSGPEYKMMCNKEQKVQAKCVYYSWDPGANEEEALNGVYK